MTQKSEFGASKIRVTYASGDTKMFDAPAKRADTALTIIQVAAENPVNNPTGSFAYQVEFLDDKGKILSTFTRELRTEWVKTKKDHRKSH